MKVIEPLFLDELRAEYDKARDSRTKLERLQERLAKIKIFDPACGSGNFLIIAYKELRELEMRIIKRIHELSKGADAGAELFGVGAGSRSVIRLSQFYGIELDDFAHEIAILALWLAEHQMNLRFGEVFGRAQPTLPLNEQGHIVHGNACRLDWEEVCPKEEGWEVFILGNPPYLGFSMQDEEHKADLKIVFQPRKDYKRLDYISCWFELASRYADEDSISFSFVSTNSIIQGEQVPLLWPSIFKRGQSIIFAHSSFFWKNSAKSNAAVIVVIIGVSSKKPEANWLYDKIEKQKVNKIGPYLNPGSDVIVSKSRVVLSSLPNMQRGNMPIDGGGLVISTQQEVESIISEYPAAEELIKKFVGAVEFTNSTYRYCIWIDTEEKLQLARRIKPIELL